MAKTKEETKAYRREYYLLNKETALEASLLWQARNPDKTKKSRAVNSLAQRDNLKDAYVKQLLRRQGFKDGQITPDLIELKRITIKTTKLCRQLKA